MAIYPTAAATDADLFVAVNNKFTTLNGAIDAVTTTIVLTSASGFPTAGYVSIDTEAIKYTGITVNTLTGVTRGADGTSAASHADASLVEHRGIAAHHNTAKDEIIAIETDLGSRIGFATDRIRGVAGSAASPTYSFAGSTGDGFYDGGTNTIGVAIGGTLRFTFDTTSLSFPDGSASSPAITFLSDPNTGIFWPAADQLNVSLGGVTKINFASSVSTLTGPLQVNDATATAIRVQGSANGTNPRIIAVNTNSTAGQNRNGLIGCAGDNFNVELSLIAGKDSSDVNVEMLSGTTKLQFAIGGIEYAKLLTTQFATTFDGTASVPAYAFLNDTNTGIFRVSSDKIGITAGSTSQIELTAGQLQFSAFANGADQYVGITSATNMDIKCIGGGVGTVNIFGGTGAGQIKLDPGTTGNVLVRINSIDSFKVDNSTTAGQTRMLVYDVDNATLERVTVGAADSGGAGFKVLRIPN